MRNFHMSDTIDPKLHSVIVNLELFILGDINKFMEIDERHNNLLKEVKKLVPFK